MAQSTAYANTEEIRRLSRDPKRPLLIVDVDEVLALFVGAFERLLESQGYEFRVERYALLQNIFRPGHHQHLEISEGQRLLDEFFREHCEKIEPAPGAQEALAALSQEVQVVVLTNCPVDAREARGRWLLTHGFDYQMVVNVGPKGPAVAAIAQGASAPVAFVDDLLPNLDSAAKAAPHVQRFHTVADQRLRRLAPVSPDHRWAEDWEALGPQLRQALLG